MSIQLDISPLGVRLTRFTLGNRVRFIPQDSNTLKPIIALSIYEAYLSKKFSSHNTVYSDLQNVCYLIAWARQSNIDINSILLQGEMLETKQVNLYSAWLNTRGKLHNHEPLSNGTINKALTSASKLFRWFSEQYASIPGHTIIERSINLELYKKSIKHRFSENRKKDRKKKSADDLSDEEIKKIQEFLKPENRCAKNPKLSLAQAIRDYLIWRLAIEFGLREGEILALRYEDCPHQHKDHISIVRIEDREDDLIDPRGKYAPRPKTLSRELGFILKNSPVRHLITEYISKYRRRSVIKHGKKIFEYIVDHSFLILSHRHDHGNPLSISSMQNLSQTIASGTGIDHFHWHLCRHAFFNRSYAAIIDFKEKDSELYKDRLEDLIYWGGWESKKSLQLYINRARRERAKSALTFYQTGQSEWEALT